MLSITLQLSLFFMVVSMALWIDQLYNGYDEVSAELRIEGVQPLITHYNFLSAY